MLIVARSEVEVEGPTSHDVSLLTIIAVACVSVVVVVGAAIIVVRQHWARRKLPTADRIVSMHTNTLYFKRYNGGLASLSEYEVPLDKNWEFPRAWCVN